MTNLIAEVLIVPSSQNLPELKGTAQQVARALVASGIQVHDQISVCPDRSRLQHAIATAISRSSIVLTIGGLGEETNFLAKQVMSEGLRLPLVHNQQCLAYLQAFARKTGTPFYREDVTLASLPEGANPLAPQYGKIPGCLISAGKQHIVMLPETPEEGLPMLKEQVLPHFATARVSAQSVHTMRTYGITEPQVRRLLADLMGTTNPAIGLTAKGEELELTVTAQGADQASATALTNPVLRTIADRLGDYAYGLDVDSLEAAAVQKMHRKELSIAIAEAGTSGMLGKVVEKAAGRGFIRYHIMAETNESKTRHLGIPAKNLRKKGDVSEYTAVAMAYGALVKGKSDLGIGICADIPGTAQKEDAQIYIAVCNEDDVYVKKLVIEQEGRISHDAVVDATVFRALNMLRLFVDYLPNSYQGSIPLDIALTGKENVTENDAYEGPNAYEALRERNPRSREETKKDKKADKKTKKSKKSKPTSKPVKEKSGGGVRKAVLTLAILVLVGSLGYLGFAKFQSGQALKMRDNLVEVYRQGSFVGLRAINGDVVAYLSIDGTEVTYPIVQAKDNAFYLRRDFEKEDNQHGIPFMDASVDVNKPSGNMVIYGHNMMDGQIFGELLNYTKLDYYKEHPTISFDTMNALGLARKGEYKIMSIFITNTFEKHGPIFNYHKRIDMNQAEFNTYVKQLELRTLINTTVDTQPGDELITLSTCDYNFTGSRFVVVARRVRMGESKTVDIENAKYNPQPLLPQVWYKSFGGSRPNDEAIAAAGGEDGNTIIKAIPVAMRSQFLAEKMIPLQGDAGITVLGFSGEDEEESKEEAVESSSSSESSQEASWESSESALTEQKAKEDEAKRLEAEKLAEEQRLAEEKKKEEELKKAEEAEALATKEKAIEQEKLAVNAEAIAKEQATKAIQSAKDAQNATSLEEYKLHAEEAKAAYTKANTAATNATTAAEQAGTELAKQAATNAKSYANQALQASTTASQLLKEKEQEQSPVSSQGNSESSAESSLTGGSSAGSFGQLTVFSGGKKYTEDALQIVARIVQNEIGSSFHVEAIKAQAVAAYTFVAEANEKGNTPSVILATKADAKVIAAVEAVLGEAIYYNGRLAFTPYHATSGGATTSSASVWGGSYPYLTSVDSSVDERARNFSVVTRMSSTKVSELLSSKLGISTTDDPSNWFEIISEELGGYVGKIRICGQTKSGKTGSTLTGRLIRENVFGLRSSKFIIEYDSASDEFVFTTYGYGHGVGMSQTGANFYAQEGWSYIDILEHYYSGATVK